MRIVTDCAADLPREEIEAHGIRVAPLYIQFPEGEVNSDDLSPDEFYRRLQAMSPRVPTTAQPSPGVFAEIYRALSAANGEILSIHVSSGLSGTIESARLGACQVPEAQVSHVDSLTLSGGQRFQVLAAVRGIQAGLSKEAILEKLQRVRAATEVIYTLETLEYLARGGRIGRVQALAGSLLKIKPIIHVERSDGKYSTVGKERTLPRALAAIVEHLLKEYGPTTALWISVMHGQFAEQARQLAELAQSKLCAARMEILRISPVLGVHTGPGIVGIAAVPARLLD